MINAEKIRLDRHMKIKTIFLACIIMSAYLIPVFSATPVELMNEGRMNLYRGNIREGIRILEEASRMDGQNLYIKYNLAKGYSWDNEWEKAKKLYNEIISASGPDEQIHWDARFGIAQITSWEKKYDEALKLYGEILSSRKKISKNFALDIKLAIGDIYSWQTDYDGAIEHFTKLLSEYPDNILILNRISKIYMWGSEYTKSMEYTEKVLTLDSKNTEASERKRTLDKIKPFTVVAGYDFTWYDVTNSDGENIKVHNTIQGIDWQYSNPLKLFAFISEVSQNSNDIEEGGRYHDVDFRLGGTCRINPVTYLSSAIDYSCSAKIYPRFSGEISLSRKITPNIDITGFYKYTYDKLHDAQTVDAKHYHLFSPGMVFYYNPAIYNRVQFYVETDTRDLNYSVLMNQYFSINPENIIQFYLFLSQGRSYLVYSDSTVFRETTTYSASLVYTHYFNSSFGIEFTPGLTTSVGNYSNYHGGINLVFKW